MENTIRILLWSALILTAVLGIAVPVPAQQKSAARSASMNAPSTLAAGLQALPSGALPNNRLLLTVAPDQVISQADERAREAWQKTLFTENPSPLPAPAALAKTLDALAAQFGCRMQTFGQVTALAPTTRIALADPNALNLSANHLPLEQALKLLLGSLTPTQMQQLGGNGLGPEDLSDDQLSFFEAVVSHPLRIMPVGARPPVYDPKNRTRPPSRRGLTPTCAQSKPCRRRL